MNYPKPNVARVASVLLGGRRNIMNQYQVEIISGVIMYVALIVLLFALSKYFSKKTSMFCIIAFTSTFVMYELLWLLLAIES